MTVDVVSSVQAVSLVQETIRDSWYSPEHLPLEVPAELILSAIAPSERGAIAGTYWLGGTDLLRPVRVHVTVEGPDDYMASEPAFHIFGAGESLAEAFDDFRHAMADHLAVLEDESVTLADDLIEQRDWLRSVLR